MDKIREALKNTRGLDTPEVLAKLGNAYYTFTTFVVDGERMELSIPTRDVLVTKYHDCITNIDITVNNEWDGDKLLSSGVEVLIHMDTTRHGKTTKRTPVNKKRNYQITHKLSA